MKEEYIEKLLKCRSLDEFLAMFFGLDFKSQLSCIGNNYTIHKGTTLYRARKDEGIALVSEKDWGMPPKEKVKKGRFNYEKMPVLYLSAIESVLPREIGIKPNDRYYVAKYECKEDIIVASFLKTNDLINAILNMIAMAIENNAKMTPKEKKELQKLDFSNYSIDDIIGDHLAVFYIHKLMKSNLYDVTNKLFDLSKRNSCNGVRYCSCYLPLEVSGGPQNIVLKDEQYANYALTNSAITSLEYRGSELKTYKEDYGIELSSFIRTGINVKNGDIS